MWATRASDQPRQGRKPWGSGSGKGLGPAPNLLCDHPLANRCGKGIPPIENRESARFGGACASPGGKVVRNPGWFLAAVLLVLAPGAPAAAGSLEVFVEPGRVAVQADEVPLGRILETLAERGAMYVLIDERRAAEPLTVRLDAGDIQGAIVRLMQEAGGGNYAIVRTDPRGKVETLLFQDSGRGAIAAAAPSQPAYVPAPNLPSYPTYTAGVGGAYAEAGPEAPYRAAPRPYVDTPTTPYAGGPKASTPARGPADAIAPRGLDHSLLTDYQLEEKQREEREGRRGTKDLN